MNKITALQVTELQMRNRSERREYFKKEKNKEDGFVGMSWSEVNSQIDHRHPLTALSMGNLRNRLCPNGHKTRYKQCCWQKDRDTQLRQYPDHTMAMIRRQNLSKKTYL